MVKINAARSDLQGRIINASLLLRWAQNKNAMVRMADERQPNKTKAKTARTIYHVG